MSVLELFSGTKSVGKVCDELNWKTISVDLILEADHKVDIMEFDYKQYDKDAFDVIWASPPCTAYSKLQDCWIGRKRKGVIFTKEIMEEERKKADKLVLKTLEIIKYFNPSLWFIENPQTGELKNREYMKNIPYYDVDYCMYSDFGYKKRTRIWTNKEYFDAKICDGKGTCGNMIEIKTDGAKKQMIHKTNLGNTERIQRSSKQMTCNNSCAIKGLGTNQLERYRIPHNLIYKLLIE